MAMPRPEKPVPTIATRKWGTGRPSPSSSGHSASRPSSRTESSVFVTGSSSWPPGQDDAEVVEDPVFGRVGEDVVVAFEPGDDLLALHGLRLLAALGQVLQPLAAGPAERLTLVAHLDDLERAFACRGELVQVRDVAAGELLALQELQVIDELAAQRRPLDGHHVQDQPPARPQQGVALVEERLEPL